MALATKMGAPNFDMEIGSAIAVFVALKNASAALIPDLGPGAGKIGAAKKDVDTVEDGIMACNIIA